MRILLAEDDDLLGAGMRAGLTQQGFQVDWVRDGVAALRELRSGEYQAVVLDLGLPRMDGMDVLREARSQRLAVPVLVLTARDGLQQRVDGLDSGADDYLIKPVDLLELAARLRALVRRAHGHTSARLCAGPVVIDDAARQVWLDGQAVALSAREYDLLRLLLLNANRVLSRERIEQQLYRWGTEVASNAVEVHIYNLRRKLRAELIETVRGAGYVLRAEGSGAAA